MPEDRRGDNPERNIGATQKVESSGGIAGETSGKILGEISEKISERSPVIYSGDLSGAPLVALCGFFLEWLLDADVYPENIKDGSSEIFQNIPVCFFLNIFWDIFLRISPVMLLFINAVLGSSWSSFSDSYRNLIAIL